MKYIGIIIFLVAFGLLNGAMFSSQHRLDDKTLANIGNEYHRNALKAAAGANFEKSYSSNLAFVAAFKSTFKKAQKDLENACGYDPEQGKWNCDADKLPAGVDEWSYRMGDWFYKDYVFKATRSSTRGGLMADNVGLFFWLIFVLGAFGGILSFLPMAFQPAGIKHNGIYTNASTKGLSFPLRAGFLGLIVGAVFLFGFMGKAYMTLGKEFSLIMVLPSFFISLGIALVLWLGARRFKAKSRSASVSNSGWLSILLGIYLIGFYIVLYFYPEYLTNWIILVDPISKALSGSMASQWFLYGFLYCLIMVVMGIRMFIKYRHNRYQLIRTGSVLFFQLSFALLIPELLVKFNNPYMDLKTPWPLDYSFFYDYRIDGYLHAQNSFLGVNVGLMMFVWGIVLTAVIVPLFTYLYGKRWYCSWVCGCGGLAETLGDPFRQQSDKSLNAWRVERWVIHGVLVFATLMTILLIVGYYFSIKEFGPFRLDDIKTWYGFFISSAFAGVVGTGFYPLMGNRVWCRFGCPLAALMGLVQKFKSRFRITTNGGQCISCGNCSTYCEMGIDVRWYAQRGQDIVRASCVGCGVCSAVCPRGVLRLENASEDVNERAQEQRVLKISAEEGVSLFNE